jgi:hypothetical protein
MNNDFGPAYNITGIKERYNGAVEIINKIDLFSDLDKRKFFPDPERQSNGVWDTYGCVSYAAIRAVVTIINALIHLGRISPDTLQWLKDKKYIVNGKLNISERFIVVGSATDPNYGNSMDAVATYISEIGLVPESVCPWKPEYNKNDYYDRSTITQEAVDLGKEFLEKILVQHEWVNRDKWDEAEKYGVLNFATYAWFLSPDGKTYYNPKRGTSNHIIASYYLPEIQISDNYAPFIKKLSSREDVLAFAMAYYVSDKNKTMSNVKIIKDTESPKVYMCLPISDENSFQSYCDNYGVEVKRMPDGSIKWDEMIDGSLELNS